MVKPTPFLIRKEDKMKNYIQLQEDNVIRIGIKDKEGNITDCVLEFDLEDIELPLRISKCEFEHKKNCQWLRNQFIIIDKKEDRKSDTFLSWKDAQKINAYRDFYVKEMEALDLFLGKGKTKEILNAFKRNPYYSMYEDIENMLKPYLPMFKNVTDDITNKIKKKYSTKEENVIE